MLHYRCWIWMNCFHIQIKPGGRGSLPNPLESVIAISVPPKWECLMCQSTQCIVLSKTIFWNERAGTRQRQRSIPSGPLFISLHHSLKTLLSDHSDHSSITKLLFIQSLCCLLSCLLLCWFPLPYLWPTALCICRDCGFFRFCNIKVRWHNLEQVVFIWWFSKYTSLSGLNLNLV